MPARPARPETTRMADSDTEPDAPLRTLTRGLQVIELLQAGEGMGFLELHRATGLPKASLTRILRTLESAGWISRRLADGCYRSGHRAQAAAPGDAALARLSALATPHLARLQRHLLWPSDISVCDGEKMVILESNRASSPFTINRRIMGLHPRMLWSAVGRVYLASCPPAERRRILDTLARSPHPDDAVVQDKAWVRQVLSQTRKTGYGLREPGYESPDQSKPGQLSAIAVPVMAEGRVIACLSLIWIASMMDEARIVQSYLQRLSGAAAQIGDSLARNGIVKPPWLERRADRL